MANDKYLNTCRESLQNEQNVSLEATNNWEHVDREKVHNNWNILYKDLAKGIDSYQPDDLNIQIMIKKHYEIACEFYTPSKEAYIGMGLFYNDNEDMKKYHNTYHPKMVDFLLDAMTFYAKENL